MNFFMEVAKMRAARVLWAKIIKQFDPKNPKSLSPAHPQPDLRLEPHRPGCLQQRRPHLHRGHGRHAGPHPVAAHQRLDEALALPTDFSRPHRRNTQLFLQQETDTCKVVDPWGGSYYVERLTRELAERPGPTSQEVEELGGMAKAIEAGIPKIRIEEAAARTQARIDSGKQTVVGVNKFRLDREDDRSMSSRSTTPRSASSRSNA
jgi:methylmalonyl-CoA mutase